MTKWEKQKQCSFGTRLKTGSSLRQDQAEENHREELAMSQRGLSHTM